MRVTKEKAETHRRRLVAAAGKLFKRHGIRGIGVADIGKAAGLTHGAVYAHFSSKDELAAEALAAATKQTIDLLKSTCAPHPTIGAYIDFSLSKEHRDDIAGGCPLTASGSEIARQRKLLSDAFAEGFEDYVAVVQDVLPQNWEDRIARERAITIAAAEIGTLIVARAVRKSNQAYSDEILMAGRRVLCEVGGERLP